MYIVIFFTIFLYYVPRQVTLADLKKYLTTIIKEIWDTIKHVKYELVNDYKRYVNSNKICIFEK